MNNNINLDELRATLRKVKIKHDERISKPSSKNMVTPKRAIDNEIKSVFGEKYEEELMQLLFKEELKKKKQEVIDEMDSPYYEEYSVKEHHKRDGEWDVLIDEEIIYFDPDLSYQITGYRPITMDQGLDFNPEPFIETRRVYERTGKFSDYPEGTKLHRDFWEKEKEKCVKGLTIGKYRITGDHYFFLNFYQMPIVQATKGQKGIVAQSEGFPNFLAKQYEFFHYVEICEYTSNNVAMLKARGLDKLGLLISNYKVINSAKSVKTKIVKMWFITQY